MLSAEEYKEKVKNLNYKILSDFLLDYLCERDGVLETISLLLKSGIEEETIKMLDFDECDINYVKENKELYGV